MKSFINKKDSHKIGDLDSLSIRKSRNDMIHKILIYIVSSISILFLALILFFVVFNSIYFFRQISLKDFITGKVWNPSAKPALFGIAIIILSTFFVLILSLLFSVPLALFSSLFICEYLSPSLKGKVIGIVRLLAGIPSVIFGLFAVTQTVWIFNKMGAPSNQNLLLASLVLGFMALPIMISLCVNAIEDVPKSYRYASLALGLSKSYTTFAIVKKSAKFGIISAVVMGMARVIGETMAIIMIAGNSATGLHLHNGFLAFLFSSIRTLAGTIGLEILENTGPEHQSALYAIGVILFIIIIAINIIILSAQSFQSRRYTNAKKRISKKQSKNNNEIKCSEITDKKSRDLVWSKVENQKFNKFSNVFRLSLMISSTIITISVTLWIVLTIIIKGLIIFFTASGAVTSVGLSGIAVLGLFLSTLILVLTTIVFALPLSLIISIYLSEYSKHSSIFKKILNFSINVMASTPSILFGMFGLSIFIGVFHMPLSILTAALTLTFLVLPLMIKSMENTLVNIPKEVKDASFALGASKSETIWKIVVPNALKGILTAVILSMARIVG